MNLPEPNILASHLRKPEGEVGVQVGEFMHKGNSNFYTQLPSLIAWKKNLNVLEIGMGAGLHVISLKQHFPEGKYTGLDYSSTMVEQAQKNNPSDEFICADVAQMPFADSSFDLVISINTVYFLPDPIKAFEQIYRVLKVGGTLCIGKRTLEDLNTLNHITQFGFNKVSAEQVQQWMKQVGFKNITSKVFQDPPIQGLQKPFQLHSEFVVGRK